MYLHKRKSPRIPNYDYTTENFYFITICCHDKKCIFGNPGSLNSLGLLTEKMILELESHYIGVSVDKYVVMPNHVHMIIVIKHDNDSKSLNTIVGLFKSGVTREIRKKMPNKCVWQRSFHDRVIRSQAEYEKIWFYIDTNPQRWKEDCFFKTS